MRRTLYTLTLMACWLAIVECQAQQIVNRKYDNVSLSEALLQLNNFEAVNIVEEDKMLVVK